MSFKLAQGNFFMKSRNESQTLWTVNKRIDLDMLFQPEFPSPGRMCFAQYRNLESVGTGLSLDLDIERDTLRLLLKTT